MCSLISHLRYTIRLLARSPGFTVVAVLVLAIGIGANVTIFSVMNGVLLKPLPYPRPDRLVKIFRSFGTFKHSTLNYADFSDYQAGQHTFESLAIWSDDVFTLAGHRDSVRLTGVWVSGAYFKVFGRPVLAGRPLAEEDDQPGAKPVVVLSEQFWRTHFNSDPEIIGANVSLNSRSFQVVGVTPGAANEYQRIDVYLPLNQNPEVASFKLSRIGDIFWCVGRLKPGITLQEAQSDFEVINQNLVTAYHSTNTGISILLIPYLDHVVGSYGATVWLLQGAALCLLAITCANVANLLLVRAQERQRDITVRAVLGASRFKLAGELLIESFTVTLVGGVIGSLLAVWGVGLIKQAMGADLLRFQESSVDATSVVFVIAVISLTAIGAGLSPALAGSKTNFLVGLREAGDRVGTGGPRKLRIRDILVASQIVFCCLLLTGSGLLIRSFLAIEGVRLGFKTDHILVGSIDLLGAQYSTEAGCEAFFSQILDRLRRLPGVSSVALDDDLPFTLGTSPHSFGIEGRPDPDVSQMPHWQVQVVSEDFFKTVGIPLLRGRFFVGQGTRDQEKQVIINQRLADSFFPREDPIGKQLHDYHGVGNKNNVYTVIGVVPNVQHGAPDRQQTPYQAYFFYSQDPYAPSLVNGASLLLSTIGDPYSLESALRQSVASVDPNVALWNVTSFDDVIQRRFASRWLNLCIVTSFGVAALLVTAVGLYGVLSYTVSQRRREIGIRIALGAQSSRVIRLIMSQGSRIVGLGLIIGMVTSVLLSRVMDSMLYGVTANDPVSLFSGTAVLVSAAFLASLFPAIRATRIEPIKALRE
jgi:putative ABC transport system permease protein